MRVKTSLWVKSYIRTCFTKGAHCTVVRKGDSDAGQVYIKCNHLDGTFSLYAQAPLHSLSNEMERKFEAKTDQPVCEEGIDKILASGEEFDPDIWVIEIENKAGEIFLETLKKAP